MSSLASVPQGAFAALRASRAGAGLRRVPVSRTSPPVRCSPGDVSATAAAVSSPPEPQDGSHRLVYVGNLDFFTPPDDVRTGLLGLLGPLASSATAVEVPGWRDLQRPDGTPKPRKRRDEGKHNRGFAVVRFDTVDAGREAALVLDRAELEGRALRSSAGVQTKQMEAAAREADAEEDSDSDSEARRAAREARTERARTIADRRKGEKHVKTPPWNTRWTVCDARIPSGTPRTPKFPVWKFPKFPVWKFPVRFPASPDATSTTSRRARGGTTTRGAPVGARCTAVGATTPRRWRWARWTGPRALPRRILRRASPRRRGAGRA